MPNQTYKSVHSGTEIDEQITFVKKGLRDKLQQMDEAISRKAEDTAVIHSSERNQPKGFAGLDELGIVPKEILPQSATGLTESEVVEIIRANAQKYVDEDTTLPPTTQAMVDYVFSYCSVYGDDINGLRDEMYNNYVSNDELNEKLKYTERYINHDMRIENLEFAHDAVVQDLNGIHGDLSEVESIAKGRATGYVFDTVDDMNAWLADSNNVAKLILGDNLYIRATDVPDYWWDGAQAQELETQKVDLTEYVKNTDFGQEIDNIESSMANLDGQILDVRTSCGMAIEELQNDVGNIETALDAILSIQNELIGGDAT